MINIVICGMYRSGTTRNYNIVRLYLEEIGEKYNIINYYNPKLSIINEGASFSLHKVHDFIDISNSYVLASFRNIEDSKISYNRCFGFTPDYDFFSHGRFCTEKYIKNSLVHESLWFAKDTELEQISYFLSKLPLNLPYWAHSQSFNKAIERVNNIENPKEYDPITLMFPNHKS